MEATTSGRSHTLEAYGEAAVRLSLPDGYVLHTSETARSGWSDELHSNLVVRLL